MTKHLLIAFLLLFSVACGNKKHLVSDGSSEDVYQTEVVTDPIQELAMDFVSAVRKADPRGMSAYYPDLNSTRVMMGQKTLRYSDDQIRLELLEPTIQRFEQNMEKLLDAIKAQGLDHELASFLDVTSTTVDNPFTTPTAIEISIDLPDATILVPVSLIKFKEEWRVLEILKTTGLFN